MWLRLALIVIVVSQPIFVSAEIKSRFYYSSIGAVYNTYVSGQGKSYIDRYASLPHFKRFSTHTDVIGKYYSMHDKPYLFGAVLCSDYDFLSTKHSHVHFSRLMVSLSAMRFFKSSGAGPFTRADMGLALFSAAHDPYFYPQSSLGVTALIGLGYAYSIRKDKNVNLQVHLSPALYLNAFDYTWAVTIGLMY